MSNWPKLDYVADKGTIETLHLLLQLIGKLPVRLHPWINHGWHVALRLTPSGAMTRSLPAGGRYFAVELDFLEGAIRVDCGNGFQSVLPVAGKSIARVHRELSELLEKLALPAPLYGAPNELPDPIPFAEDERPREWDPDAARRLHGAFLCADRNFNLFRSLYLGKSSPSHLFWGSFDLAVTRFSGRGAPAHPGGVPNLPDDVTREAYSHEVISAGFWPGGGGFDEAAFYAYAYPTPPGLAGQPVGPKAAFWKTELGEFILPYAAVREASDPDFEVQRFLRSTFAAAGSLLEWPKGLVIDLPPSVGHPPHST
ncbi:DUF5996 family protein [Altererythrobacter sp. Root672]|uniref:DUF5996 family protein n=1 Tax=Altererythrobacter sp. Root672 TaxID=1736584 RepID=UPI0006FD3FE6|nr:DUF5996 family protein [Altererythrobacter sp. Root672]KRA82925.1 hypothetical protein ASD76_02225 [Altererythrobacter sp. Root672]